MLKVLTPPSPVSNRSSWLATASDRADQNSSRMTREDCGKPGALVSSLSSKVQTSDRGDGDTESRVSEREERSGRKEALKFG